MIEHHWVPEIEKNITTLTLFCFPQEFSAGGWQRQRLTEASNKTGAGLRESSAPQTLLQTQEEFKSLFMLLPFIMHHPGDTESQLHGSRARPRWAHGRVGRRLGRQARFWEAGTRDDLVIGLSGFVSVNVCTMDFILTWIFHELDLQAATSSFSLLNAFVPLFPKKIQLTPC